MEMLFPIIDASDCSCLSWKQKENYCCIEGKCTPAACCLLRYRWTAGGTATETLAFVKITKNGNDVKLENVQ